MQRQNSNPYQQQQQQQQSHQETQQYSSQQQYSSMQQQQQQRISRTEQRTVQSQQITQQRGQLIGENAKMPKCQNALPVDDHSGVCHVCVCVCFVAYALYYICCIKLDEKAFFVTIRIYLEVIT